jgi:hypothetical protein
LQVEAPPRHVFIKIKQIWVLVHILKLWYPLVMLTQHFCQGGFSCTNIPCYCNVFWFFCFRHNFLIPVLIRLGGQSTYSFLNSPQSFLFFLTSQLNRPLIVQSHGRSYQIHGSSSTFSSLFSPYFHYFSQVFFIISNRFSLLPDG